LRKRKEVIEILIWLNPKSELTSLRIAAKISFKVTESHKYFIEEVKEMPVPIIGFESKYMIDEFGNVYNINGSIMHPYITNKGYKAIDFTKDGKRYKFLIHRLVALHFVPNPNGYPIVLHKDNIKTNTYYNNLEWGTYSQNNSQAIRDGLNKVPRPDNNIFYNIFNNNGDIVCSCYGVNEVKNITKYPYSISGLYSLIFRNGILRSGPYIGCTVMQSDMNIMTPAVTFN